MMRPRIAETAQRAFERMSVSREALASPEASDALWAAIASRRRPRMTMECSTIERWVPAAAG
jgi:hypothetical protein